jgi:PIN domain nuclease of toxin-antitoxin system
MRNVVSIISRWEVPMLVQRKRLALSVHSLGEAV